MRVSLVDSGRTLFVPPLYLCYGPSSVLIVGLSVLFVHLTMNAFSEGITSAAY